MSGTLPLLPRRKKNARERRLVVELQSTVPPPQWIPTTKKPSKVGVTMRQVTRISIAMAVVGYLLLSYVRMRSLEELNRAVRATAVKSAKSL